MRRSPIRRHAGFTLLEVLVSLSILALSYAAILQIMGGAANKAALAGDYRNALIVAESRLDYAAANLTSRSVESTGLASGRYHWVLSYEPTNEYSLEGLPARYVPVKISVRVSWENASGRERFVALSTLRLARGQAG
jgi:general secretion pathway protein I